VSEPTHKNDIPYSYRKVPIHFFALRKVSHAIQVMAKGQVMNEYFSRAQRQETYQSLKKGGFTGTIRAHYCNPGSVRNLKRDIPQNWGAIICNRYIINIQAGG
jgi:hypothetical protein